MALITVGLPFYNSEDYLYYAIISVIHQSFTDWKLILIDDGSTDGSLKIASSFISDSRIILLSDGINRGLIFRLNQLIEMCDTPYLARMDADDIMHPYRLEKQYQYLQINPQVDVLGSFAYSINTDNEIQGILKKKKHPQTIDDVFRNLTFIHPTVIARTDWWRVSMYEKEYERMEDKALWSRKILSSHFENLELPLLYYRDIGIPYLAKYLKSASGDRKLIKKCLNLMWYKKILLVIESYVKSFIYVIFTIIKKQDYIIRKRSMLLSSEEKERGIQGLFIAIQNDENTTHR